MNSTREKKALGKRAGNSSRKNRADMHKAVNDKLLQLMDDLRNLKPYLEKVKKEAIETSTLAADNRHAYHLENQGQRRGRR